MDALKQLLIATVKQEEAGSSFRATTTLPASCPGAKSHQSLSLGWLTEGTCIWNLSTRHFSLSPSLPLLSLRHWAKLGRLPRSPFPLCYAFSNSHMDIAAEFQPQSPAQAQSVVCCLIDFQILSLFCCGLRQGASRAAKNMWRVSMTMTALRAFFPPSCGQEHKGNKSPPGDRTIVAQTCPLFLRKHSHEQQSSNYVQCHMFKM